MHNTYIIDVRERNFPSVFVMKGMKMKKSNNFPFLGLFTFGLTFVFVVLKFAGITAVADWSWLWVFSPLWISFLIGMGLIFIIAFVVALGSVLSKGE